MAQFLHADCKRGVVLVSDLKLVVATLYTSLDEFSPATVDLRMLTEDGKLETLDAGGKTEPTWFCPTCKRKVEFSEVLSDCFGCGGQHPAQEMYATLHTAPVRMDCYSAYRASHEEEQLPRDPKTKPLSELVKTLVIKL